MKRELKIIGIILCVVIALLSTDIYFRLSTYNPNQDQSTNGKVYSPLYLVVETDKHDYSIGENITIRIKLVNDGANEVIVRIINYSYDTNCEIINSSNYIVYSPFKGLPPPPPSNDSWIIAAKSEKLIKTFIWDQKYRTPGGCIPDPKDYTQVPSGIYLIEPHLLLEKNNLSINGHSKYITIK